MNIEDKALDIILDHTSSSEWEDVCELTWSTAAVLELLIKAINKGQTLPIDSVSKRVFCFLYSDGNEVYNKSSLAETRTEARKTIEDKFPKLFLVRNELSYENVC